MYVCMYIYIYIYILVLLPVVPNLEPNFTPNLFCPKCCQSYKESEVGTVMYAHFMIELFGSSELVHHVAFNDDIETLYCSAAKC